MTTQGRPPAYFVTSGDTFVPTAIAKGPWGQAVSGNFVGGLLGHAVERTVGDPDLQPARLTVDLLRPVALTPVRVGTEVLRRGRRLTLVDAQMTQDDALVARATALFLRRGDDAPGQVWTSPVTMPPAPPAPDAQPDVDMMVWAYGASSETVGPSFDLSGWQHAGPKYAWVRDVKPLIDAEHLTPFVRAAMAADVTSSLTHISDAGLHYINADYTLTLSRLPRGQFIGLAALTHYSHRGVATGTATLFDNDGPLGSAVATALVNPGFRPRPA